MGQVAEVLAAFGLLGAGVVGLVLSPAGRGLGGERRALGGAMRAWIGAVALLGLVLPLIAVGADARAERPVAVGSSLLAGLLVQLLAEGVVTRCQRPGGRAWLGFVFTLARCGQVLLLWATAPVGAGAVALGIASVLWPANLAVLCGVLGRRWRARPALA